MPKSNSISSRDKKKFQSAKEFASRAKAIDAYGFTDVLPNPDPILRKRGIALECYRELLSDPHLTAVISSRKAPTTAKKWEIVKNKASATVTKFVQECYDNFDVKRANSDILNAVLFGYQPMEIMWGNPENGKIKPYEFIGKPAEWFQYNSENVILFRSRENSWPGEPVPNKKLLIPRHNPSFNNPYGEANLSRVYWSVNFKQGGFKHWVEFTEKYGSPFLMGKVPRTNGDNESTELQEILEAATKGSSFTMPDDSNVEAIITGTKGNSDIFKALCDFSNSEMSKAFLGQTLTTEAGNKGTQALGTIHNEVRLDLVESDENLVEGTHDNFIRWIVDINFGESVEAPGYKFFHEEDLKKELAERDTILKNDLGVNFTEQYIIDNYNLKKEDFTLEKEGKEDNSDDNNFSEFAETSFKDQQAVDALVNSMNGEDLREQTGFVQPIIDLANDSNSFEEMQEGLIKLFPAVRPEELEDKLRNFLFASQTFGNITGPEV